MKGLMDGFMSQQNPHIQSNCTLTTEGTEKENVPKKTQQLPTEILKRIVQKNLIDDEKRDTLLEQSLLKGSLIREI